VNEPLDATDDTRSLQKHVSSKNIVHREFEAVSKRVVHMGLCGEVHDRVDLLGAEQEVHQIRT